MIGLARAELHRGTSIEQLRRGTSFGVAVKPLHDFSGRKGCPPKEGCLAGEAGEALKHRGTSIESLRHASLSINFDLQLSLQLP